MKLDLKSPVIITGRLLPGVRVGDGTISIEYGDVTTDSRRRYRYYIDLPDGSTYTNDDVMSGVGGQSLQSGLQALMSFLGACAESVKYSTRTGCEGENNELFPANVGEWAAQNSDEIGMVAIELEETRDAITEAKD